MRTILLLTATALAGAVAPMAQAQAPWSALPGGCASTDNNFYNGVPSSDFPVARYRTPGGAFAFNGFHDGDIAVICNVDNPRFTSTVVANQVWNRLQVTYRDPDGLGNPGQHGSEYQAFVQLTRVSKTTGAWSSIATHEAGFRPCFRVCSTGPS